MLLLQSVWQIFRAFLFLKCNHAHFKECICKEKLFYYFSRYFLFNFSKLLKIKFWKKWIVLNDRAAYWGWFSSIFLLFSFKNHYKYIDCKTEECIKTCHCLKGFIVNITTTYSMWDSMNMTSQFLSWRLSPSKSETSFFFLN